MASLSLGGGVKRKASLSLGGYTTSWGPCGSILNIENIGGIGSFRVDCKDEVIIEALSNDTLGTRA